MTVFAGAPGCLPKTAWPGASGRAPAGSNVLWAMPLIVALLIRGIAITQQLRTMPGVQNFILRHPGVARSSRAVYSGFPLWPRLLHCFNLFFIVYHPRRHPNPRRSPPPLLEAGLHAWHRVVSLPARSSARPDLEVER